MKCNVHPEIDAIGTCSNCGLPVCPDCSIRSDGKFICKSCIGKMTSMQPGPASAPKVAPVAPPVAPPVAAPVTPPVAPPVAAPVAPPVAPPVAAPVAAPNPAPYVAPVVVQARKEPILSLILSFFIPGLGQAYNGQMMKGIIMAVLYFGLWIVAGILTIFLIGLCLMPVPILLWLYAMYDAYTVANKINRGEHV